MPSNDYMKDYNQKRAEERREVAIWYLGGRCEVCGSTEDLHIDHVDPTSKLLDINRNWLTSWVRLQKELDKCQLLCSEHHVEKTRAEEKLNIAKGEKIANAKLIAEDIIEIRRLKGQGYSNVELAKKFSVSRGNISHIVNRVTWKHV